MIYFKKIIKIVVKNALALKTLSLEDYYSFIIFQFLMKLNLTKKI